MNLVGQSYPFYSVLFRAHFNMLRTLNHDFNNICIKVLFMHFLLACMRVSSMGGIFTDN